MTILLLIEGNNHNFPLVLKQQFQGRLHPGAAAEFERFLHRFQYLKLVVSQVTRVESAVLFGYLAQTDQLIEVTITAGHFVESG